jgi:hypothetical protein
MRLDRPLVTEGRHAPRCAARPYVGSIQDKDFERRIEAQEVGGRGTAGHSRTYDHDVR